MKQQDSGQFARPAAVLSPLLTAHCLTAHFLSSSPPTRGRSPAAVPRERARFAPPCTEVIVVDDGSRGAVVSRAAGEFAGVKVIRHEKAGGFCAAANAGIAAATRAGRGIAQRRCRGDRRLGRRGARVVRGRPRRRGRAAGACRTTPTAAPAGCRRSSTRPATSTTPAASHGSGGMGQDRSGMTGRREIGTRNCHRLPCLHRLTRHSCLAGPVWGASAAAAFYRRDAARRRRVPRTLRRVLRGRGSVVPAAAAGLRDRVRTGVGGLAPRVGQLRASGRRGGCWNSSRATRSGCSGGTSAGGPRAVAPASRGGAGGQGGEATAGRDADAVAPRPRARRARK